MVIYRGIFITLALGQMFAGKARKGPLSMAVAMLVVHSSTNPEIVGSNPAEPRDKMEIIGEE